MDFTAIKGTGQGSFMVKKGAINKLLFLLKTIGIYLPIASVNDPFNVRTNHMFSQRDPYILFLEIILKFKSQSYN